jgi:uncharacterized protein (TIGR02246 family)
MSDARTVLQDYLAALTAGDLEAIAASFAEDAVWSLHGELPLSGTKHGRDAILEFLVGAASLFAPGSQRFTFGEVTAGSDRVALEWRVTGIGSATGRRYDNEYCGVFVIRDGHIVQVREYMDSLHAADVLFDLHP